MLQERDETIPELEQRLTRYPAERYPVQHATTQFHLGVALANAAELDGAEAALRSAVAGFAPDAFAVERAKALNALGATLRLKSRLRDAAECFARAAELFDKAGQNLERGAALFNLGLVQRDLGDTTGAMAAFQEARGLLEARTVPAQAGAAARELGVTLLGAGDLEQGANILQEAVELAERAGDHVSLGAAANALGLAHLAADRIDDAVKSFNDAVAANPKNLRPQEYAMAKANVALAYERAGKAPRARLAALQAAAAPTAPEPVRAQARGVIERLGNQPGDLLRVLDTEAAEAWVPIVREELARWMELSDSERRIEAAAWIDGQLARPASGADLAEAWLDALLELPPEPLDRVIRSFLGALSTHDPKTAQYFRSEVSRAMARFHVPQWMRLKEAFNRIARELGDDEAWG